jgi:hypothetical protein
MTTRPERVKIISKRFTIEYVEMGKSDLDPTHLGECRTYEQRIMVEEGLKLDTQKDTLFHEVIHAVSDEMGLEMSEEQVSGSAKGILAVLMDNPTFARYLLKKAQ